jgi:hypothetical protein
LITRELHKSLEPFIKSTGWQHSIMWSLKRNNIASLRVELFREITILNSELNTIVARSAKRSNTRLSSLPSPDHQGISKDLPREDQEKRRWKEPCSAQDAPLPDPKEDHLQRRYFDSLPSKDELCRQGDDTGSILSFLNLPYDHPWARDADSDSIWSFDTV